MSVTRADALKLTVAVENTQAVAALRQTETAVQRTATSAVSSGGQFSGAFGGMSSAMLRFSLVAGGLTAAVAVVSRLAERADDIGDVTRSFEVLSRRAGITGTVLADLRKATEGEATAMQLMQTSNLAMQAGLPLTNQKLTEMAELATKLGASVGVDAAEAFDNFTTAIVRMSDRQLRAMGIMVDAEEAAKSYAKAHGLTVEVLTETERQQAFMNEAMEKGAAAAKGLSNTMPTLSGWFKAVGTAAKDAGADVLSFFDKLPAELSGAAQQQRIRDFIRNQQAAATPPGPAAVAGPDPRIVAEWDRAMDKLAEHYKKLGDESKRIATEAFNEKMSRIETLAAVQKLNALFAVQEGVAGGRVNGGAEFTPPPDDFLKKMSAVDGRADLDRNATLLAENETWLVLLDTYTNVADAEAAIFDRRLAMIEQGRTWTEEMQAQSDVVLRNAQNMEIMAGAADMVGAGFQNVAAALANAATSGRSTHHMLGNLMKQMALTSAASALIELAAGAAASSGPWGVALFGNPQKHFMAAAQFGLAAAAFGTVAAVAGTGGGGGVSSFGASAPSGSLATSGSRPFGPNDDERDVNVFVFLDGDLVTTAVGRKVGEQIARDARRTGRGH
jgi:hypothetical protein